MEKAWELYLLLVPRTEAFALPNVVNEQRQISCNNQNDKKSRVNTNIYSI